MENSQSIVSKIRFLRVDDASVEELDVLERVQRADYSRVQLPKPKSVQPFIAENSAYGKINDGPNASPEGQTQTLVAEGTCRLPPEGIEMCDDSSGGTIGGVCGGVQYSCDNLSAYTGALQPQSTALCEQMTSPHVISNAGSMNHHVVNCGNGYSIPTFYPSPYPVCFMNYNGGFTSMPVAGFQHHCAPYNCTPPPPPVHHQISDSMTTHPGDIEQQRRRHLKIDSGTAKISSAATMTAQLATGSPLIAYSCSGGVSAGAGSVNLSYHHIHPPPVPPSYCQESLAHVQPHHTNIHPPQFLSAPPPPLFHPQQPLLQVPPPLIPPSLPLPSTPHCSDASRDAAHEPYGQDSSPVLSDTHRSPESSVLSSENQHLEFGFGVSVFCSGRSSAVQIMSPVLTSCDVKSRQPSGGADDSRDSLRDQCVPLPSYSPCSYSASKYHCDESATNDGICGNISIDQHHTDISIVDPVFGVESSSQNNELPRDLDTMSSRTSSVSDFVSGQSTDLHDRQSVSKYGVAAPSVTDDSSAVVNVDSAESVVSTPPVPVQPVRAWASLLFDRKNSTTHTSSTPSSTVVSQLSDRQTTHNSADDKSLHLDKRTAEIASVLSTHQLSMKPTPLQPRGLTNKSNWCYVNATLQALLHCAPFYNLLKQLPPPPIVPPSAEVESDAPRTPIIDALVRLVGEFGVVTGVSNVPRRERAVLRDVAIAPAFEPDYVYAVLTDVSRDAFRVAGRQEDAEEFLTCLLSGLQDEMALILSSSASSSDSACNGHSSHHEEEEDDDSESWQTIVGKNRGQVTRSVALKSTPVSRIFAGQLRSSLHRVGSKTTATVQSFFSLQLDIQDGRVNSVSDALNNLAGRDTVDGVTCPVTGQPVAASQQATLEQLPPILILHLKRFLFDSSADAVQKLHKRVNFPVDLDLSKDLLSSTLRSGHNRPSSSSPSDACSLVLTQNHLCLRYRLFAVVCHGGRQSSKGHYICDAYHSAHRQWLRYDDGSVTPVTEATVLSPDAPLVPYILFYQRRTPADHTAATSPPKHLRHINCNTNGQRERGRNRRRSLNSHLIHRH